jgi:hypothetical protein
LWPGFFRRSLLLPLTLKGVPSSLAFLEELLLELLLDDLEFDLALVVPPEGLLLPPSPPNHSGAFRDDFMVLQ